MARPERHAPALPSADVLGEDDLKFEGIHRILVPVDFSSTANRAFDYARDLAAEIGAELHIVYVLDTHYLSGTMHINIESEEEMMEKWRKRSREKLNTFYGDKAGDGTTMHLHLKEGKPHREILAAAKEVGADILIMGTHGRSGLERTIFGSVAEKVMKMADIPVLLIKLKGESRKVPM